MSKHRTLPMLLLGIKGQCPRGILYYCKLLFFSNKMLGFMPLFSTDLPSILNNQPTAIIHKMEVTSL